MHVSCQLDVRLLHRGLFAKLRFPCQLPGMLGTLQTILMRLCSIEAWHFRLRRVGLQYHSVERVLQRLLAISEEQMQDIMLLRRIYVTRRGLHALERRALVSQAPISHHQIPLPSDNLTQLSDLASQLKKNAADDYRVYHRVACASRRGVRHSASVCIFSCVLLFVLYACTAATSGSLLHVLMQQLPRVHLVCCGHAVKLVHYVCRCGLPCCVDVS